MSRGVSISGAGCGVGEFVRWEDDWDVVKRLVALALVLVMVGAAGVLLVHYRRISAKATQVGTVERTDAREAPGVGDAPEAPAAKEILVATRGDEKPADTKSAAAMAKGLAKLKEGDKAGANRLLLEALENAGGNEGDILKALRHLGRDLFFDPVVFSHLTSVRVKRGDTLSGIGARHGCSVGMIKRINHLRGDLINVGQRLMLPPRGVRVAVSKRKFRLVLTMGQYFVKDYPVGLGKRGSTPTATFVVKDRIPQPNWYPDEGGVVPYGDPNNPLGTRWLGLGKDGRRTSYGIHGTWNNASIGKSESRGCIRMRNRDVEELFDIVPVGAKVIISP